MKQFRLTRVALPSLLGVLALAACSDQLATNPATVLRQPAPSLGVRRGVGVPTYIPGQIIVRFADGADGDEIVVRHGKKVKERLALARTVLVEVAEGTEEAAAAELAAAPGVEFAEVDQAYAIVPCEVGDCSGSNDSFMSYKWDLHNDGSVESSAGEVLGVTGKTDADIDWMEMYDALGPQFAGAAIIGILDTGIRPTHNDLAGRVIAARGFATGYASTYVTDDDGHGTHVAGIAAARGNNGFGHAGVAYSPNIRLLNAKVCGRYKDPAPDTTISTLCPSSSVANGIVWAVDNGAKVLNLSLGGDPAATNGSAAQRTALAYAVSKNVLAVCATGNDNYNGIAFPARFADCMAVGATNWSDERASYSNYGSQIAVTAPGGAANPAGTAYSRIRSASHLADGSYVYKSGTSMATPQVAGLAAMLYATGMTSVAEVRARLMSTADDLGEPGWDPQFGAGRINAYRAITGKDPYAPPVAAPGSGYAALEGSPVSFDGSASFDPNNHPITFSWLFGDGSAPALSAKPTHTFADDGSYTVALTVTDESDRATTVTTTATIANVAPAVSVALDASTILSGGSVALSGTFSDPGVKDAPWGYAISWGNGATGASVTTQATPIVETRRFCSATSYAVRLTVTDKDGGAGSADAWVTVRRNEVAIDAPASVNAGAMGRLPVTVFGSATLDAAAVDASTATLGDGGGAAVPAARRNNGSVQAALEDVNGDGRPDLVLHFERAALAAAGALPADAAQLVLHATMADGCVQIRGATPIRIVP